jgi:hypothetical protein
VDRSVSGSTTETKTTEICKEACSLCFRTLWREVTRWDDFPKVYVLGEMKETFISGGQEAEISFESWQLQGQEEKRTKLTLER